MFMWIILYAIFDCSIKPHAPEISSSQLPTIWASTTSTFNGQFCSIWGHIFSPFIWLLMSSGSISTFYYGCFSLSLNSLIFLEILKPSMAIYQF